MLGFPSDYATARRDGTRLLSGAPAASGAAARALLGAWFYERAGDMFYDASPYRRHLYPTGVLTDFSDTFDPQEGWVKTCLPTALRTGRYELANSADLPGSDRLSLTDKICTIMFRARFRDDTSGGGDVTCIIGRNSGITGQNGWLLATNTANQLYYAASAGSSITFNLAGTHLGAWRTYAVVLDQASATKSNKLYMDESEASQGGSMYLVASNSSSTSTPGSGNLRFAVMNSSEASRSFEGDLSWIMVWDRLLSMDELSMINAAPRAAFRPGLQGLIIPRISAGGGGGGGDPRAYVNYRGRTIGSE